MKKCVIPKDATLVFSRFWHSEIDRYSLYVRMRKAEKFGEIPPSCGAVSLKDHGKQICQNSPIVRNGKARRQGCRSHAEQLTIAKAIKQVKAEIDRNCIESGILYAVFEKVSHLKA